MISRRGFLASGNLSFFGTLASGLTRKAFADRPLPTGIEAVVLAGYDEPGDPGRGAIYRLGSKNGLLSLRDYNGRWWELCPGKDVWAGWFGALGKGDDTDAFQLALDYLESGGGGGILHISPGSYTVAKKNGRLKIGAGDDGHSYNESVGDLPSEIDQFQAYCLRIPNNITISGEGMVVFTGGYKYGSAGLDELICMAPDSATGQFSTNIRNISFRKYFIGFGGLNSLVFVLCNIENISFYGCAIGIYLRSTERCNFWRLQANLTACLIAVGGQWATRRDTYDEGGGFSDKCTFREIHNNFGRGLGLEEARIDAYFDAYVFRMGNNDSRLGPPEQKQSIAKMFPYLGLAGRGIYIMARHGRPSNSNVFSMISHAFSPRPAIWIDNPIACVCDVVYLERCGYLNPLARTMAIGRDGVDPFLGEGVRMPAFVRGVSCVVDAQDIVAERVVEDRLPQGNRTFRSDLAGTEK